MAEGREKNLSRQKLSALLPFIPVYPCSAHFVTAHTFTYGNKTQRKFAGRPLCTARAARTIWRYTTCLENKKGEEDGSGGMNSFYSIFILLGSGSLLLSCSSPSPCRLTSIPSSLFPSSPSSLLCFPSGPLPVRFYEYRIFSFFFKNPRTWELWAKARGSGGHSSSTSRAITQLT